MRCSTVLIVTICVVCGSCSRVDEDLDPVSPVFPEDRTVIPEADHLLRWSSTPEAETYHIQIGGSSDLSRNLLVDVQDLSEPRYVFDRYRYERIYRWRVRYRSGKSLSPWAGPWVFATYTGTPAIKHPADGALLHDRAPRLSWSRPEEATAFDIRIRHADTTDPEPVLLLEGITEDHAYPIDPLEVSRSYTWSVRARFPDGIHGEWCSAATFRIVEAWDISYGAYDEGIGFRSFAVLPWTDGFCIAGNVYSNGARSGSDICVAFIAPDGDVQRVARFDVAERDECRTAVPSGERMLVAADIVSADPDTRGAWLCDLDSEANVVLSLAVTGDGACRPADVSPFAAGGFVVAGSFDSEETESTDCWVARFEDDGTPLWWTAWGGSDRDAAASASVVTDGILVYGTTRLTETEGAALSLVKIDPDGEVIWARVYDAPEEESGGGPESLAVAADGTVLLTATSEKPGMFGGSVLSIRCDEAGRVRTAHRFSSSEYRSFATAIADTPAGDTLLGANILADTPTARGLIRTPKVVLHRRDGTIVRTHGSRGAYPQTVESLHAMSNGGLLVAGWWYAHNLDTGRVVHVDREGRYPVDLRTIEITAETADLFSSRVSIEQYTPNLEVDERAVVVSEFDLQTRLLWP